MGLWGYGAAYKMSRRDKITVMGRCVMGILGRKTLTNSNFFAIIYT